MQTESRVHTAIASLPPREQKVIGLYYYGDATMKEIGANIGVNESRVSQLHARAIRRLREALEATMPAAAAKNALRGAILAFQQKPRMAKAGLEGAAWAASGETGNGTRPGVVVNYPSAARLARSKAEGRKALGGQAVPMPSRKRAASAAATAPVAKMARRGGVAAAVAR